jgi:rhodanese-related sulfurtransferase
VLVTDAVLLSIGVRPDTRLASTAGLQLGSAKGILVNEFLQTSNADIYAVGDAIEFENPITHKSTVTYLAGPANKQGRICADNVALGNVRSYKGSINTAIVKVFDMTVGATGVASKHLTAAGIEHIVSTTHNGSHAGYYPGAKQMTIQIVFAPKGGRLLGAQIAGYDGVDKRLDVFASYIKQGKTIYDLIEFEHAYAPPYSSAKDPVNMAGFVAENILLDRLRVFYWNEVDKLKLCDLLIDVRRKDEFDAGNIAGAINIPVDELRDRLHEIPRHKNIYIYCEAGLRGYLAQRILRQHGFDDVANLSGGYYLWKTCIAEQTKLIIELEDFLIPQ